MTIVDPIFRNPLVEEIVRNTSEPLPSIDHEPLKKLLEEETEDIVGEDFLENNPGFASDVEGELKS